MKFCSKCGKEILDEAVVCVHCGCPVAGQCGVVAPDDAPNAGFSVLGFFIPIAGLILYLIYNQSSPLKAKSAGKGAIAGLCTSIGLIILYIILIVCLVMAM